MMRFHGRVLAWLALGSALSLGACDSVDRLTDVTQTPAYSYNKGNGRYSSSYWLQRLTPASEELGYRLIGAEGGTLEVGGHRLVVPKKAVKNDTWFIMRVLPGENIHVDLNAYKAANLREVTRFDIPVRLVLSLADTDPSYFDQARVAYLVDGDLNGQIDLLPGSWLDRENQTITALLLHFSNYAVCID